RCEWRASRARWVGSRPAYLIPAEHRAWSTAHCGEAALGGQGEGGHPPGDLAGEAKRLTAGGQEAQVRSSAQERFRELGARREEVLAVVQHQEELPGR